MPRIPYQPLAIGQFYTMGKAQGLAKGLRDNPELSARKGFLTGLGNGLQFATQLAGLLIGKSGDKQPSAPTLQQPSFGEGFNLSQNQPDNNGFSLNQNQPSIFSENDYLNQSGFGGS